MNIKLINILILIFPFLPILTPALWCGYFFSMLCILGFWFIVSKKINFQASNNLYQISTICLGYFCLIIFSSNFVPNLNFSNLNLNSGEYFFLLAPLAGIAISLNTISLKQFLLSIKLALILIDLVAIYKSTLLVLPTDRVLWTSRFGVILIVMSWINIKDESKKDFVLTLFSSLLAINALMLSGFRASVISLFLLTILFILISYKYFNNLLRIKIFIISILSIIFFTLHLNTNTINRFQGIIYNFLEWNQSLKEEEKEEEKEDYMLNSTSQRLEMIKNAYEAAKQKPLFGYGYNNSTMVTANFSRETTKKYVLQHDHLHNTYLNTLVNGGLFSLIIQLILLIILPLKLFINDLKHKNSKYAHMGIILIFGHLSLSFFETFFFGIFEITFYLFFLLFIYCQRKLS